MTRKQTTRLVAGAAGLSALALGAIGAFPSGASQSPVSPASLSALSSVPSLPNPSSPSQCVRTPQAAAVPSPVTASGAGSSTTPVGKGSIHSSSSRGVKACVTNTSGTSSVPGLPSAGSIPGAVQSPDRRALNRLDPWSCPACRPVFLRPDRSLVCPACRPVFLRPDRSRACRVYRPACLRPARFPACPACRPVFPQPARSRVCRVCRPAFLRPARFRASLEASRSP